MECENRRDRAPKLALAGCNELADDSLSEYALEPRGVRCNGVCIAELVVVKDECNDRSDRQEISDPMDGAMVSVPVLEVDPKLGAACAVGLSWFRKRVVGACRTSISDATVVGEGREDETGSCVLMYGRCGDRDCARDCWEHEVAIGIGKPIRVGVAECTESAGYSIIVSLLPS